MPQRGTHERQFHISKLGGGAGAPVRRIARHASLGHDMTTTRDDQDLVLYEVVEPGIVRIQMNRPAARNAQDSAMTYALHAAFDRAAADDGVRVVILSATDPHFSSGHDLREAPDQKARNMREDAVTSWGGFTLPGAEGRFAGEQELYLQATRRWRDFPKPTIAQVQGKCIAGGLMLAWACDLIVASEDAEFCDPVVGMGVCGVEWFVHPYELGARKAKELLFTADSWSAEEARSFGMVNRVVPRASLAESVLALASKIAAKPLFGLKMAKQAVNQAQDLGGQQAAIDHAFGLHQLCHAHNMLLFGKGVDPSGIPAAVGGPRVAAHKD